MFITWRLSRIFFIGLTFLLVPVAMASQIEIKSSKVGNFTRFDFYLTKD